MRDDAAVSSIAMREGRRGRKRPMKEIWRRIRKPLARSRLVKHALARVMAAAIRLVERTNPRAEGSDDVEKAIAEYTPAIAAFWHGQHLLAPALKPRRERFVALFSRSADAELNALVAEKLGFETVRGSGGREGTKNKSKGGAAALIQLKRTIDAGCNVAMIADIPHGTPREAGLGVVTLAKLSGRPVIPVAIATSRRKVLERSWDKTTINLPFGRSAVVVGEPIYVAAEADEEEMERKRREVTDALNRATGEAYRLVDRKPDRDGER
ncbi:lysophospholipid acyltransferase family protein [Chelativorans sp.]|uniref:lysophospholipid acyltransferase family protein n=1 Tax=Chelativorans sp. TaxID=2203393 RepID=UPI002811E971|nr:lysophospholipid acyltransferase family protein [Chelativorans sp.]